MKEQLLLGFGENWQGKKKYTGKRRKGQGINKIVNGEDSLVNMAE